MSDEDIAQLSSLSLNEVRLISQETSWAKFDLMTIQKFTHGCQMNFDDPKAMKRVTSYILSEPSWLYLKRSNQWTRKFEPLLLKHRKSVLSRNSP